MKGIGKVVFRQPIYCLVDEMSLFLVFKKEDFQLSRWS